ncbi:glycine--tRNA ligase subunit beta [Heyndrickxia acidicola]|uniref:Glycine--tRNA ligase beta subunit n=1 Tax=Heyndrickxia acidicola TaxID=209389 RepID=A0ABU6ML28_9BACI|nr:glycine--tRNA ligase subunit beta [Heyndrickxia acidicola]MED1205102.1 glycine--tRNA ligase subunit beta [Heyndrickxia acidicola]
MSKRDFLLEVGLEEMPARFVTDAMNQLNQKLEKWLEENKISFSEVISFSSPRRLAVLVKGMAESQEDIHEEAKGPAKKIAQDESGNWSKAAIGFCRGQGMSTDDIYFKEIKGVEYAHVKKFIKGQKTASLLPNVEQLITSLNFPKNMKWADYDLRFIRPIKWLVALFGKDVIPFEITNVSSDRITYGHRFLGHETEIHEPSEYEALMLKQYVVVDPKVRKESILEQLHQLEKQNNWVIPVDEDLLEEVTNLVEYPTALYGTFNEDFLRLPEQILITSMKEHQRYFPVKDHNGNLLPFFVTVRNGDDQHLDKVAKGNEKVLRARLSDADFFFNEDQKLKISDALKKLETIVYHEKIGTLSEKVGRIRSLTGEIASLVGVSTQEKSLADRAAEICKFDLVTQVVYEFPELQGFMGEKYALQKGEAKEVAAAINEHYKPRDAEDTPASTVIGAIVGIADKLDTIVSSFAIDIIPTGSQDPFALRRQASGIVQTLLEKNWEISLEELLKTAIRVVTTSGIGSKNEAVLFEELKSFFKLRLKYLLQENQIRYDIIEAILNSPLDSVPAFLERASVLNKEKDREDFKQEIEALSRVLNIASKAENVKEIDSGLFETPQEQELYNRYLEIAHSTDSERNMEKVFKDLAALTPVINDYFDNTMVMANDVRVKENRLSQMRSLADIIERFASLNEIIVK